MIIDGELYYYNEKNELIKDKTKINNLIENYNYNINFDLNLDIDKWEKKLNRNLNIEEKILFVKVLNEKEINKKIFYFKKIIMKSNCFIKAITNYEGNCLFESLISLGITDNLIGDNKNMLLRENISSILLENENNKDFFPNLKISPKEIFNNMNEIETIKEDNKEKKYDYHMMIDDLKKNGSWKNLPTELILMIISRIYNLKIIIFHDRTHYTSEINQYYDEKYNIIRLGLIGEEHYFPILELDKELHDNPDVIKEILDKKIEYNNYKNIFKSWSKVQKELISNRIPNLYLDNQNNEDIEEFNLNDFYKFS